MARTSTPQYTLHRPTGQARVRIDGKDHYLGKFGRPESRERYDELIAAWIRRHADEKQYTLTVDELAILFCQHADRFYRRPDSTPTGEATSIRHALRFAVRYHGTTRVRDFGPKALKEVRQRMIEAGHCRTNINRMVGRIKRMFAFGVEEELVPADVHVALLTVRTLREGRTDAAESDPVAPVPVEAVQATLPHLPAVVADMVRLQLLTAARPGEICMLRPCDVDTSGEVWVYKPRQHKTRHKKKERRIHIGPRGQAILRRYLARNPEAYCFSPAESEARRRGSDGQRATVPLTWDRSPKARYTKDSLRRAIERGCEVAFRMPGELRRVPAAGAKYRAGGTLATMTAAERARRLRLAREWRAEHVWNPNQLRHSRLTEIRERYKSIEHAQVVADHSDPQVTQVYAEKAWGLAASVMKEIG